MSFKENPVLIGMFEGREREELARAIARDGQREPREVIVIASLADLQSRASRVSPRVIVLEARLLEPGASLDEVTRRLAVYAPVVVVAPAEWQGNLAGLVQMGEVDFVAHAEGAGVLTASLVIRRLRAPQAPSREFAREFTAAWAAELPSDFSEILRHEINNPLTGILGNAELLLAQQRGKLPPASLQRLETIVDLAVRLRETIRRLTVEWEREHPSLRSA
ncbi:MAG TPA: histidine kinase dimerization/phospho-acceptor domain-containing protein [Candidatus Acidoferrales bacterium]|nr:histidine kinase dimerization/phospho-acceptor domain-containing protein [Candidatus Acidoferrales bacterium]